MTGAVFSKAKHNGTLPAILRGESRAVLLTGVA